MAELRARLTGDDAHLGEVAASDVANLILGVERALSQAASVIVGRPKTTTGRREQLIANAVRLRLRAVEEGSVVPVMEIPDAETEEEALDLDVPSLGEAALDLVIDATKPYAQPDPVIAKAVLDLADRLRIGERYEELRLDEAKSNGIRRMGQVDGGVRQRLRMYVESASRVQPRSDALVGVLVEADFEKRTARLKTPTDPAGVQVTFDDELADDIQDALRKQASFRGDVVYDRKTHAAKSVNLQRIERGEQLVLGLDAEEFWQHRSFDELALIQGSGQPADLDALYDADATDEERDAFMAAISELD